MTRTFIELPLFRSKWEKLGLTDKDLRRLQEMLLADPKVGAVMRGTGGIRKMRFAFEHQGKSGSVRVIQIDFEQLKIGVAFAFGHFIPNANAVFLLVPINIRRFN